MTTQLVRVIATAGVAVPIYTGAIRPFTGSVGFVSEPSLPASSDPDLIWVNFIQSDGLVSGQGFYPKRLLETETDPLWVNALKLHQQLLDDHAAAVQQRAQHWNVYVAEVATAHGLTPEVTLGIFRKLSAFRDAHYHAGFEQP